MASQVTSGYSTEGTQYAQNNSFYLLDTVPGAGAAIPGPVTIAGNLTVTGTTTLQGAAGATSLNTNVITAGPAPASYTATGNLSITALGSLSEIANGITLNSLNGNVSVGGVGSGSIVMSPATGGSVNVTSAAVNLNASTQAIVSGPVAQVVSSANGSLVVSPGSGPGSTKVSLSSTLGSVAIAANGLGGDVNVSSQVGDVILSAAAGASRVTVIQSAGAANNGFGVEVRGKAFLTQGLALGPTQGTYAAPAAATNLGGAYGFTMLTNKAFITTGGAVGISLTIDFPGGAGADFIPILSQIGTTPTNVASYQTNGNGLVITPSNPLNPVVVGIVVV
jgi:hypothetical protein